MMKKKILSTILSVTMLFSVSAPLWSITSASAAELNAGISISNPSKMPTITPPANTHPRVMFTEDEITYIRDYYWNDDENEKAVTHFNKLLSATLNTSAAIGTKESARRNYLDLIQARAFDYALNKNNEDEAIKNVAVKNGQDAVAAMANFLSQNLYRNVSGDDISRDIGYAAFIAAEVYDWCYDIMDDTGRAAFITECENNLFKLENFEITYPAEGLNNIIGHAGEYMIFRDLLAFGIAVYDEKPAVYNHVMSRIEYEMAPARKWFYESGAPYQGDMYGFFRYLGEIYAEMLVNRMSGGRASVFTDDTYQGFKTVPMHWLYMHRPDGRMFTRGDDNSLAAGLSGYNTYHFVANFFAGNLFEDKYIKGESLRRTPDFSSDKYKNDKGLNAVTWLIVNNPYVAGEKYDRSALPENIYFESPAGEIIAKTKWNYGVRNSENDYLSNNAVSAYMRIGEYYGSNHDDLDSGSFQLYYKGILASGSGFYDDYSSEHTQNYRKRTISHNALTISGHDPTVEKAGGLFFNSKVTPAQDGGQKIPTVELSSLATWQDVNGVYKRATVLDHYVSGSYSYIKGDLTPAYESSRLDENVPIIRNMAFIETGNRNVPAFMIVYDKLKGATSSNVPQFNLHTQTEPTISGDTTTVITDGGKMTVKTLLPENANIKTVGGSGKEFYVDGKNYAPSVTSSADESGWGRIEITPKDASATTEFLNVLAVSDKGYSEAIPAEKIVGTNVTGAKVLTEVVLFSQTKDRVKDTASFTISGSDKELSIKILGITPGLWSVKKDDKVINIVKATMDAYGNGATLSFKGDAGVYELVYTDEELEWKKIFEETMQEYPNKQGTGPVYEYFTASSSENCYITTDETANYAKDNASDHMAPSFSIKASGETANYLSLNVDKSPLQDVTNNTRVKIEFDFASDGSSGGLNLALVGDKNGRVVQSKIDDDAQRFINTSGRWIHYKDSSERFTTKSWNKMTIDLDCATQTYDVYLNGTLSAENQKFPIELDQIYGVSFASKGTSWANTQVFVDNIRYYTLKLNKTAQTYAVTLNANGGSINNGNITEYAEGDYVLLPINVTKQGFVFGGWYENADLTGSLAEAISMDEAGDKNYYAKWLSIYSVTLNANGGSINSGSITEYIESFETTLPADVTKDGYKFKGWYENADFSGNAVTKIPATATGNKTYYAKWDEISYIGEGAQWEKIYEETMEETTYDCAYGTVNEYFAMSDDDYCYVTNAQATGYTKSEESEFKVPSLKVSAQKNNTRYANLIVEKSPLYDNPGNTKVRIEFDFATDKEKGFYIILVGEKDGKAVQTTAGDDGRFIFTDNGRLNYESKTAKIDTETWYKMVIDLDCESQTYDVYLNGEISVQCEDFPITMDKIYGVSFAARSFSATTTGDLFRVQNYIDNLRYYTLKLSEGITTESVQASYVNGELLVNADVTGYTSLKTGVKFIIAIYDENDAPIAFRIVDYKAGENLRLQEENKDLEKASYVKLFVWNTAILKPLGGYKQAEVSFESQNSKTKTIL